MTFGKEIKRPVIERKYELINTDNELTKDEFDNLVRFFKIFRNIRNNSITK